MENVRYNIAPCSPEEANVFIDRIDKSLYSPKGCVKADEHSHYDRYSFVRDESKVAVVYDTSAQLISITAPQAFADELLGVFGADGRQVKRSTVPAQSSKRERTQKPKARDVSISVDAAGAGRAKLFVTPESLKRRGSVNSATVIATARGSELSTDEIFPPQRAKRRVDTVITKKAPSVDAYFAAQDTAAKRPAGRPKKATISIGDNDEFSTNAAVKPTAATTRSGTGLYADIAAIKPKEQVAPPAEKPRRGRPPKAKADADTVRPPAVRDSDAAAIEYKNGYSVKNFPEQKLAALLQRLESAGYTVKADGVEFAGTSHEVKTHTVSDGAGAKVYLRYATKKMTVQLQGKRSELFGEVQSQVSQDTDYSSALEGYVDGGASAEPAASKKKVSDVEKQLKKRLPTAYEYLSEQSRIDFSYGIHDFSQGKLMLSDYSVLLVPPFRGLERFVFDLQRAEGIKVKMIGQAFDKDDSGRYVLKDGYVKRISSVVYCEVLVALYTEYFSRRNFFAHSDNSEDDRSRAIPDREKAKAIFESLLDTVEYNARKLKEIGFRIGPRN